MTTRLANARIDRATPAADAQALRALLAQAQRHMRALDVTTSLHVVRDALRLARHLRDRAAQARAFSIAAGCHYYRGDYAAAVATGLDAYTAYPELDHAGRAQALEGVTFAFVSAQDFRRAGQAAERALGEAGESGDISCIAQARNVLGIALAEASRFDESLDQLRRARALFRRLGDLERVSATAVNTGHALAHSAACREAGGDRPGAVRNWRRARSFYRMALASGRPRVGESMVRASMADCELHLANVEAAHSLLHEASQKLRARDPERIAARIACLQGEAERRLGRWTDAWRHLRHALERADAIAGDDLASECREALARLAADCGLASQAREWTESARHERYRRRQILASFRREMRPLWDRYFRLEAD